MVKKVVLIVVALSLLLFGGSFALADDVQTSPDSPKCHCGSDCKCEHCAAGKPCNCAQHCQCGPDCKCEHCGAGKPCHCAKHCQCGPDCKCEHCASGKPCTCPPHKGG